MNWKHTWLLWLLCGALFGYIYFVERHASSTSLAAKPLPPLLAIKASEITGIKLSRTNQLVLRVERLNAAWNLVGPPGPLFYPAETFAVEGLLQTLETLGRRNFIPLREISSRNGTMADFGLDLPQATLTLLANGRRIDVLFGSKTPVGDQVYIQLLNSPGIYAVSGEVFDRLPQTVNDWRDMALLNLEGLTLDRVEVRSAGRGFAVQVNPTNKMFYLSKPTPARADAPKVEAMLRVIESSRVVQFVSDDPRAELESYGLQPPEAEVIFGQGTNDLIVVQFGKSPTNDPSVVFARRLQQTNIVLVAKTVLAALQTSPADLRDRRLLSFPPEAVDTIEVAGLETFTAQRQTNGSWSVLEPQPLLADADLVGDWLRFLTRLEGNVEKDVVTDFAGYGLASPARLYSLKASITNAAGLRTNQVLAQLEVGLREGDKVFARRRDENSVYSISLADFTRLPTAAWQLRDRQVWSFATNQVSRVSVRNLGYTRQMIRDASGKWSFAPGSQGIIRSTEALEETIYRLGQLRAAVWVDRGEAKRALYGFTEESRKITIELKTGTDKPQILALEFGGLAPSHFPYAIATVDGQSWIFEFPLPLYSRVVLDLGNPPLRASAAPP